MSAVATERRQRLVRHLAGRLRDGGLLHASGCDVCAAVFDLPLTEQFELVRHAGDLARSPREAIAERQEKGQ